LTLCLAVALVGLAVTAVGVSASTWHAARAGDAVAAKKKHKCKKKKKHKSAATARKKKCKKKHKQTVAPPVTPPKGPIERIRISWPGTADVDVHAWSNGLHDGWNETLDMGDGDYEVQIPGTTYDNSATGGNTESIVETNPNPSVPMTFGICNYPFVDDPEDADVTVTTVLSNGQSETDTVSLSVGGAVVDGLEEGGEPDPVDDWCPEPL
jgi:hypothetical protein